MILIGFQICVLLKFNQYQISNRVVYDTFGFEERKISLCERGSIFQICHYGHQSEESWCCQDLKSF